MPSDKARRQTIFISAIVLVVCLFLSGWAVVAIVGIETQTTDPSEVQIVHARDFLYIDPELDIEPIAYYEKEGMDYQVMFKFMARTDDPAQIFDDTQVDSSSFEANYVFKRGEDSLHENLWDMTAHKLEGGSFWVPKGAERFWRLDIGFFENGSGTFTVYTWRHETGISERE